jgi:RhtB (resistance to homoserine/threonine) family protein
MVDAQVVTFTVVAAVLTLTPGADTLLVVRNVLRGGRYDGMVTTCGICSGLFVHAALSALGVSVLLMHSANAFQVVKLTGAGYLVWLGIQSVYGAVRGSHDVEGTGDGVTRGVVSLQRCFLEGFLSNVLNPKVAVFYLAFLPQFIGPTDPVWRKSLLLAGIHYAEGLLWLVTVAMVVDQTRRFFLQSVVRRWLDGVCGALLVSLGVRLAFERQ